MPKLFFLFLFLANVFLFDGSFASSTREFNSYPLQLKPVVKTMERLPEVQALLELVQQSGMVKIEVISGQHGDFDAFWSGPQRTILINPQRNSSDGTLICSILFELHNALANPKLKHLTHLATMGAISKQDYVEKVERIEHQNALHTCQIIEKGIKQGIFPTSTRWTIYEDFSAHFKIQQTYGHSAWLAERYDELRKKG